MHVFVFYRRRYAARRLNLLTYFYKYTKYVCRYTVHGTYLPPTPPHTRTVSFALPHVSKQGNEMKGKKKKRKKDKTCDWGFGTGI